MVHDMIVEERFFSEDIRSLKEYDEGFENAYDNGENYEFSIKLSILFEICPRKSQKKQLYNRLVSFLNEKGIVLSIISRKKEKYQDYVLEHKTLKKVGYFKAVMDGITDPVIKKAFVELLESMKKKGYEVVEYDFKEELLDALYPTYMIISCAEAGSNNANLDGIRFGPAADNNPQTYKEYMCDCRTKGFSDLIKRRFVIGSFALLAENQPEMFNRAQKARRLIVNAMNEFFDSIDFFISPAAFSIPKKIKDLSTAWSTHPDFLDNILTIGNFGGYPSITLPLCFDEGMPIGVNVTGRCFEDGYVLSCAQDIEDITKLHDLVKEVK